MAKLSKAGICSPMNDIPSTGNTTNRPAYSHPSTSLNQKQTPGTLGGYLVFQDFPKDGSGDAKISGGTASGPGDRKG